MKMEKNWQLLGWFLDQFDERNDHLMKISLPPEGSGAGQGIVHALDLKDGEYVELSSKALPVEDLKQFLFWMGAIMAYEKEALVFPPSPGKTTSGSGVLTFPGKTVYFHLLNYCCGDTHRIVSEISISHNDIPSDFVRNRFEALQIVKRHKIKEPLSDKALMQVAVALSNKEARS